jgi:hypothetical protein
MISTLAWKAIMKRRAPRTTVPTERSKPPLSTPARNYFAELEQPAKQDHPVDVILARDRHLRAIRLRAARQLRRLRPLSDRKALLDFEAERNHLDGARVEAAFNLGYERGRIEGRIERLRRWRPSSRIDSQGSGLRQALLQAALKASMPRAALQASRLEIAWALTVDQPIRNQ